MTSFSTSISIKSTSEDLWALLTDAPGFPDWNTTVDKVEGTIMVDPFVKTEKWPGVRCILLS